MWWKRSPIPLALLIVGLFIALSWGLKWLDSKFAGPGPVYLTYHDAQYLRIALWGFYTEYEEWPSADPKRMIAQLTGDNRRKIVFLEADEHAHQTGEMLDRWGHPLRFEIVSDRARVWSVGKDGIDQHGAEGSDDIASWRDFFFQTTGKAARTNQ